ncbi:MAG TPA: type II toxin-antitoxin system prevent-host-death family antitoxin [Devosia sp.]|jgi:prevent-host-death family protein|uniref:type II toxin-antitoxin system prevent-host-death family antitoxin n=1 Tax=Devosia sp. TaxID=1871048 RepID=UPI002DDCDB0B|nr:type II toxin-antitoxin system prevent-host-death family antitoxin [Devosia sp.]HEV2514654.1 type II toxin-antitoxin system prevent-host-death family antitoxin [Devosia sp.]
MAQRSYSTSDLSRKSGDIIAEALRHPVTLTQRNKPRLVVLNIEEYEEMRKRADPRRVIKIGDLTEIELEEMQQALDKYMAEAADE